MPEEDEADDDVSAELVPPPADDVSDLDEVPPEDEAPPAEVDLELPADVLALEPVPEFELAQLVAASAVANHANCLERELMK